MTIKRNGRPIDLPWAERDPTKREIQVNFQEKCMSSASVAIVFQFDELQSEAKPLV